ncbi:DNA-directed RNA polymerase subunit beta' [Tanacetum coccineum]|uniref:DNA-directed RNA polymerase subunit beta n=1 Tax=Tanacetum coccineum TaxID=301880 RepID=A0ABQ5DPD7_9ASTR
MFFYTNLGLHRFLKENVPQWNPAEGQSSNAQCASVEDGNIRLLGNKRQKETDKKGKGKLSTLLLKLDVKQKFQGLYSATTVNTSHVENDTTSFREAVTSSEGQQWREAIKSEIESILQNHTWELVDLPPGCKPLGYKWIFKKKMKVNGTIDKYKARLEI